MQAESTNQPRWRELGRSLSIHSTRGRLTFLIFTACSLIYAISPQGRPAFFDLMHGAEVTRVAQTLALEGSFAHPYASLPTGPTAHTAPAYALLYASVMKTFGFGRTGAMVLWALNVGLLALQLALLPVLSERLGLGLLPGVLAAAFGVIVQPYRVLPEWESLLTGALMVTLCVLTLPYLEAPREWRHSFLLGMLWGIAILVNPECVLLMFAWSHIAAIENAPEMLSRARRAMIFVVAGAAVACLPWFVRNYQQFHAIFFIRDNLGLELATSNNACAGPTLLENINSGCYIRMHPNPNAAIAAEVIEKGEVRFNHDRLRQALAWIQSNPRAFAWLTARRFVRFWFPYLNGYRYAIPTGVLTILSFVGLALMLRAHRRAALLFASTLLVYPFIHYLIQFEARFRYPIFWATLLPAAYAVLQIVRLSRNPTETSPSALAEKQDELISI
jgi:hypothetical protein